MNAMMDDQSGGVPPVERRRRQVPTQLNELDPLLPPSKDGRGLGRPDIVAGFEIGGRCREYDGGADLAERLQIGAIGHVIAEIVAHGQICGSSSLQPR